MEKEFDQYEFENFLKDEFFNGNEKDLIGSLIKKRLATDEDFEEQYELWIEESGFYSWKHYYEILKGEVDIAYLESFFPKGDEDNAIND